MEKVFRYFRVNGDPEAVDSIINNIQKEYMAGNVRILHSDTNKYNDNSRGIEIIDYSAILDAPKDYVPLPAKTPDGRFIVIEDVYANRAIIYFTSSPEKMSSARKENFEDLLGSYIRDLNLIADISSEFIPLGDRFQAFRFNGYVRGGILNVVNFGRILSKEITLDEKVFIPYLK